jgi:hypothetical protein
VYEENVLIQIKNFFQSQYNKPAMNPGGDADPYPTKDKVKEKILSCLTGNKDDFRKNQKVVVERIKLGDKYFPSHPITSLGTSSPSWSS